MSTRGAGAVLRGGVLALLACVALAPRSARADESPKPVVLRIATLAPEGSSWMRLFRALQKAVEGRTAGRVRFLFYTGGSMGDEKDVLRKMKLGQLSGAAITTVGLSAIDGELRTVEVARSYEQLDRLRAALAPVMARRFQDKGYVLLGYGDVGPVRFFSNRPVRTLEDLRATRPWLWSEDPVSRALFEALELKGSAMGVPDVLPALGTHRIDAFFGSPLSTLALQWSPHVRYVTSLVVSQATGAVVLSASEWARVAPADRAIVAEEGRRMEAQVLARIRGDNDKALAAMKLRGLEEVPTPPELERELRRRGDMVLRALGEGLSQETRAILEREGAAPPVVPSGPRPQER